LWPIQIRSVYGTSKLELVTFAMFRSLLAVLCLTCADASAGREALRHGRVQGFVKALEFKHRLRVCNAYPYSTPLDVIRGKSESLTGDEPMAYKSCRDFAAGLKAGDKLEFKVGDSSAGTFAVSDLPNNDAVLLLVIHRHDTVSTAVSFESHMFANLQNAQVAILDTYKGAARASPRITDVRALNKNTTVSEELRYNSVVAVNPGEYEVDLVGEGGLVKSKGRLVALNHESYVVLRTGVESKTGQSFEEELVVFPESDASSLHSGGTHQGPQLFLLAALCAALSFQ